MSYEKKMKDLLARLVAMSPEPPPYPEETPMATNEPPRRRAHPALVFAGAVALVAALAVPVILLSGDEPPVAGGTTTTTTVASTSTSQPGTSSTTTQSTSTTTPSTTTTVATTTWQGTVFLYQAPDNSFLGNPALVPIALQLSDLSGELSADAPFTEALAALGPELPELPADAALVNAVPADVEIVSQTSVETDNGHLLTFDMSPSFLEGAGGLLADYTMLNQLIYTMTEPFLEGAEVLFTVSGQPVEAFGSEGLDLTQPVDRETFQDELALIFLTEPILGGEDGYLVSGRSNTFEAMLTLRVVDSGGNTVHEEPVQATSGSGTWGDFEVTVESDMVVPGETSIQLFEYSAEDGSMVNVITVPIPANGVWDITTG